MTRPLQSCTSCGWQVSATAQRCPKCGARWPVTSGNGMKVAAAVTVALIVLVVIAILA